MGKLCFDSKIEENREKQREMEEDFVNKSKIYPWYFAAYAIFIYTALSVIPEFIESAIFYRLVCIFKGAEFCWLSKFY